MLDRATDCLRCGGAHAQNLERRLIGLNRQAVQPIGDKLFHELYF